MTLRDQVIGAVANSLAIEPIKHVPSDKNKGSACEMVKHLELEATWEEHKFMCDRCYWKYRREDDREAECERGEEFRVRLEKMEEKHDTP